jgi:translocator protein
MGRDTAKVAASIAVFYVVFFVGGMFHAYYTSGSEYTLRYSLALPETWLAALGSIVIGYGLWRHYRWAWWLGLVGVALQLIGISQSLSRFLLHGDLPPASMLVVAALFVIFTVLLLLPKTRAACIR